MNMMLKIQAPRSLGTRVRARIDGAFVWVTVVGKSKAVSGPWVYDVRTDSGVIQTVTEDKLQ